MLKLNMGCGQNRAPGYVNVDAAPACQPDTVWDLERTPWPWESDSVSEVRFIHSLEHMGADPKVFLAIMSELYRICVDAALVRIEVPHPRHEDFINDPTHVRAITPAMLALFDREENERWKREGRSNTTLALYTGVDFKITEVSAVLAEPYLSGMRDGKFTPHELDRLAQERNNVIAEWRISLTARKAARALPLP